MSAVPGSNPANVGVTGGGPLQGGALNFGSVPAANDYQGAYSNALNLNQQNYANILSGYQQTAGRQQTAQQAIEGGYGNLYNTVLGGIQGIGASQAQAINDAYAQQSGSAAQQMINSGLGNTTVQQSTQRGLLLDRTKAQTGLANQLAQLQAGYQSNLGLAGLNYANQANMQNTALSGQQLGWMNSVSAPYPNAAAYGQLALQQGYANRANQLYGQIPRGGGMMGSMFGGGGGGAGPGRGGGFGGLSGGGGAGGIQSAAAGAVIPGRPGDPNNGQTLTLPGGDGATMTQEAYNAAMANYGGDTQASYGKPGIPNNLYDAQGNPIAGQAGIAGTIGGDGSTVGTGAGKDYSDYYYGGGGGISSIQGDGASIQGDGATMTQEAYNAAMSNYGGYY